MSELTRRVVKWSGHIGSRPFYRFSRRFDWGLLGAIVLLALAGLVNLYSATHGSANIAKFNQQLMWTALGMVLFFTITVWDHFVGYRLAWVLLLLVVGLLIGVEFTPVVKGSQRWIPLGFGVRLQPSEFAKIAVIVAMARILHDRQNGVLGGRQILFRSLAMLTPFALVVVQPDLGTGSIIGLILVTMAVLQLPLIPRWFLALSLRGRILFVLLGLCLLLVAGWFGLPQMWHHLQDYQKKRITCFIDPNISPTEHCWQVINAVKAVGSGRLTGKGLFNATQNRFNFLPEHWTDFPLAVWAEEWGFLGSTLLLLAFVFLLLRVMRVAFVARDVFGSAVAVGVAAMIFWHTMMNVGMVLSVAPAVGVTLPLFSYGGSSMLAMFLGLGLVSSIAYRSRPM